MEPFLTEFAKWDKEELVRYLGFLLHSYRVMDAFWFINIENDHGMDEACRVMSWCGVVNSRPGPPAI